MVIVHSGEKCVTSETEASRIATEACKQHFSQWPNFVFRVENVEFCKQANGSSRREMCWRVSIMILPDSNALAATPSICILIHSLDGRLYQCGSEPECREIGVVKFLE